MKIKEQEPMRNHTTWRIGGPADLLVQPESVEELQEAIQMAEQSDTPYYVIGGGSNLLVADEGIAGTVIQLGGSLTGLQITDKYIIAEAGVPLPVLARKVAEYGLSGLEFAAGIPGSVGGAVVMNAGAYGGEMKDVVRSVDVLTTDGRIQKYTNEEMQFGYRRSRIAAEGSVVLEAVLELEKSDSDQIQAKMDELKAQRIAKQPLEYGSAGSTFKRPEGYFAGKLIQDAGLRGFRIGDAQVSEKHCGFVINRGNATASEIAELIREIQKRVLENSGVHLETEVKFLGNF